MYAGLALGVDVAPYVGAWIEIATVKAYDFATVSHLTWVRGLKLPSHSNCENLQSCTLHGVRGLKHIRGFARIGDV